MKLAIIDIDGVVADATKRFEGADVERSLYLAGTDRPDRLQREATDLYWRAALDPAFVHLDTLIDGVNGVLLELQYTHGYRLVFLTSRPESMREETVRWLVSHLDPSLTFRLTMKAPGFQYIKTPVWKVGMCQTLIAWFEADEVIFVDDERSHWLQTENVRCYTSLAAVFAPPTPVDDSDPFLPDFPD